MVNCVFCDRIEAGMFDRYCDDAVSFVPLNPVTPGHLLIVPRTHVANAVENPYVTARTMFFASQLATSMGPCNIITSCGKEATQSIMHLHIHIVPRKEGDGLTLPWTGQEKEKTYFDIVREMTADPEILEAVD